MAATRSGKAEPPAEFVQDCQLSAPGAKGDIPDQRVVAVAAHVASGDALDEVPTPGRFMVVVERAQGPNLNLIVPWRLKRGNECVQLLPHAVGAKHLYDL